MVEKIKRISQPFKVKKYYFNSEQEYKKQKNPLKKPFRFLFSFLREILMYAWSLKQRFQDFFLDNSYWIKSSQIIAKKYDPVITWIGHSSFLIQLGNVNILTDPVFGDLTFLFKRIFAPGIPFEKLPNIDYLLISHNHRDHLDIQSLEMIKQFYPYVKVLVPQGDKKVFNDLGFMRVVESTWWEKHEINTPDSSITFTFLPARHWSGRNFLDNNKSLWGSWMIEVPGYRVYFGGDTAYWDHFKDIGEHFFPIDIALLPIGPCSPSGWMKDSHMDAALAGQAMLDLKAKYMVPMHWGTFYFGTDRFDMPVNQLIKWWGKNKSKLQDKKLMLLGFGEQLKIEKQAIISDDSVMKDLQT
ncbi:hypothetical protein A3F66_02670 [candidate division TM6 bacterium RIFCSPHIGHO2_12_FULL_32_22]|nr:MAG: hypothetical protein A3F66_02670 [candidate division TM6 bacterium RIFCSPHIGHO2_12_FULL_32_22]